MKVIAVIILWRGFTITNVPKLKSLLISCINSLQISYLKNKCPFFFHSSDGCWYMTIYQYSLQGCGKWGNSLFFICTYYQRDRFKTLINGLYHFLGAFSCRVHFWWIPVRMSWWVNIGFTVSISSIFNSDLMYSSQFGLIFITCPKGFTFRFFFYIRYVFAYSSCNWCWLSFWSLQ